MRILKWIWIISIICLLTILTQVGGLVYLLSRFTYVLFARKSFFARIFLKLASFLVLYLLITFLIVPVIAKPFGRVPLPLIETNNLKPLNLLTCLLNRNYVKPELKQTAFDVAKQMNQKFPGTVVNYLDANFPFINSFPLFPHLSHNDGKKLDLSFCYISNATKNPTNTCPSFIGYGICEEPLPTEKNTAGFCADKGYWRYSLLKKIVPQGNKTHFSLDNRRTRELVNLFASQQSIGKIFIEPHLKTRLGLTSEKIKFHGCGAVRHDDHLHVQLN